MLFPKLKLFATPLYITVTVFALADALKSAGSKVEEFTETGVDTEVTDPTELPNEKVNLSPVLRVSGLALLADTQRKALDAWFTGNIDGLTLNVTLELWA